MHLHVNLPVPRYHFTENAGNVYVHVQVHGRCSDVRQLPYQGAVNHPLDFVMTHKSKRLKSKGGWKPAISLPGLGVPEYTGGSGLPYPVALFPNEEGSWSLSQIRSRLSLSNRSQRGSD